MDAASLDTAVILVTARIFDRPGEPAPAGPFTNVGGLSLFQRTLLTLRQGGIGRFVVLTGEEAETLKQQLRGDDRVLTDVRWLPVREFPPGDPRTWEILSGMIGGPFLVAGTGAVFPASLVARLRESGGQGEPVVVVGTEATRGDGQPDLRMVRRAVEGADGGVLTLERPMVSALALDLVALPENCASPGWAGAQDGPSPLQAALGRGIRQGQVRVLPLGSDWYQEVWAEDPATLEQAEWTLLKDRLEGFVGRHFNRPCPTWVTRVLRQIIHLLR